MHKTTLLCLLPLILAACTAENGTPVDESALGYQDCEMYFDCGVGRYCNADQRCWSDCRTSADCALLDRGPLCNLFGECVEQGGEQECEGHADCGEGAYCNGRCSGGGTCGSSDECAFGGTCSGTCAPQCATDNDCLAFNDPAKSLALECTPIGLCMEPGWEKWIPPGELPPTTCKQDSHCLGLGWAWYCDCPKTPDAKTGIPRCDGGAESVCTKSTEPLDFGAGPESSPAHDFTGVWGMRMEIAVVTLGLPLVTKQNTYSANLLLVKVSHPEGDSLVLEEKLCDIQLINFIDSDEEFDDLAWMVVPLKYLKSLPIMTQHVELASGAIGAAFETDRAVEVRGCVLADPFNDPLPDRHVFDADPDDPRFIDQDEDGHVGMTTLMDGVLRGAIYNVQRWSAVYRGNILDPDHIKGLSSIFNEQLVISASTPSLVYDTQTEIHTQADRTYFRLQRLSDDASCADLIRMANRDDAWLRHTPHMNDVADP